MEDPGHRELLNIAKAHLGYPDDTLDKWVPHAYIEELRKHLWLYPHDINYTLLIEPGRGFGRVTCLEQGCNSMVIALIDRISEVDGGLKEGLGSLSAYRRHISEHSPHVTSRDARISVESTMAVTSDAIRNGTPSFVPDVKTESTLLHALDEAYFPPHASSSTSVINTRSTMPSPHAYVKTEPSNTGLDFISNLWNDFSNFPQQISTPPFCTQSYEADAVWVKPEVLEPEIPRKRLLSTAFTSDISNGEFEQIKRPKHENVEDIRGKIADLQIQISVHENAANRLSYKTNLSKSDAKRLEEYNSEIFNLRRRKDEYNASIPNISAVKGTLSRVYPPSTPIKKLEYSPAFPPAEIMNFQPVASSSDTRFLNPYEDPAGGFDDRLSEAVLQRVGHAIPLLAPIQGTENFDGNGDYHGRGRDTFVGPQAKADDIDKFLVEAGNAEQFDGNANLDQALAKLGLRSQYDLLPGMEVALMPHQTIGVAWMIEKEKSKLKGGCLGDDMGLGKTVQMIATLLKNRSEDPIRKTNLIVAPTALLNQWKLEIETKTNCGLQCLIYHGSSRPKRKQDLLKYDVVLTTYSTMALEWPDYENELKKLAKAKKQKAQGFNVSDSDDAAKTIQPKKERGLLFQIDFYRVILDEAQSIRNRRTRTSRAVTSLQSIYRWCLTGTPIINSLVDVYGYLRFLEVRPWYDFQEFQRHIGAIEKKRPSLAVSRLQAIIATFLLRRMKDSMLDGKRLIELPDKTVSLIQLEFSEEEREIYSMVEAGAQANFNRYLKEGTVLKNYSQVLVLLLRLRQVCSHPSLIQEGAVPFLYVDEAGSDAAALNTSGELARAQRLVSAVFVAKMKARFKDTALQRLKAEKESIDAGVEDEECPICFDAFTDAVVTPCTHVFCRDCLVDVLNTPSVVLPDEPTKYKPNERPCPACRSAISTDRLFARSAFLPSDAELLSGEGPPHIEMDDDPILPNDHKGKGKARSNTFSEHESSDIDDENAVSDFIVEDDYEDGLRNIKKQPNNGGIVDSDDETPEEREVLFGKKIGQSAEVIQLMPKFLPSTKMKYMMERLHQLVQERPDEKTLVVSQWTGCLSLVSDYLTEKGVIHVKYQGDMNRVKRDQAVRVFMSKDKARVMLMSLKCGGVGLNLTRANNVISLDLGWSQAVEAQGFDRVHRLGQTRSVVIQRLVISNTVEDRILAMQARKQLLADGSLGEGAGKKIGRLSVKELANLFGLDHRGRLLQN